MNRSSLFKLMFKINKIFTILNKHFYILPLLSLLSKLRNNKIFQIMNWIIKLFIFINIILSVGYFIYFTDFVSSFNSIYSIYYDILEYYIELMKNIFQKIINFGPGDQASNNSTLIKNELESILKDSTSNIRNDVREGMREAIDEALNKMQVDELNSNSNLLKYIALTSSLIFGIYIIFILPGSSITPESLNEYNWVNQSLIDLKINIKDFIINLLINPPTNPGGDGIGVIGNHGSVAGGVNSINQISPSISVISDVSSVATDATITPNTSNINTVDVSTQTIVNTVESSTQTIMNGKVVSKLVATNNILGEVLQLEVQNDINRVVNEAIKNITD